MNTATYAAICAAAATRYRQANGLILKLYF